MARRREAVKRSLIPDPIYNSIELTKFINAVMKNGKKSTAEAIVYGALKEISTRLKIAEPLDIFMKALENVSPIVEVRPRRVGGSTYQIPMSVRPHRRQSLGMRWLIEAAHARTGKSMLYRLASEFSDALENRGAAFKKKENVHSMAQANKAFAHFNKDKESFNQHPRSEAGAGADLSTPDSEETGSR